MSIDGNIVDINNSACGDGHKNVMEITLRLRQGVLKGLTMLKQLTRWRD